MEAPIGITKLAILLGTLNFFSKVSKVIGIEAAELEVLKAVSITSFMPLKNCNGVKSVKK